MKKCTAIRSSLMIKWRYKTLYRSAIYYLRNVVSKLKRKLFTQILPTFCTSEKGERTHSWREEQLLMYTVQRKKAEFSSVSICRELPRWWSKCEQRLLFWNALCWRIQAKKDPMLKFWCRQPQLLSRPYRWNNLCTTPIRSRWQKNTKQRSHDIHTKAITL